MTRERKIRLAILALLLVGLVVAGKVLGLSDQMQTERVREWVEQAGPWGAALFLAVFCVGLFLHVPGVVFVAAAIFLYGRLAGGGLALLGSVAAVTASFYVVRTIGGKALGEIDRPLMKRLLAHIDERPIRIVIALRLVFWMFPPLNYALALTNVRARDYILGSALGLLPVIGVMAIFFDWLFAA